MLIFVYNGFTIEDLYMNAIIYIYLVILLKIVLTGIAALICSYSILECRKKIRFSLLILMVCVAFSVWFIWMWEPITRDFGKATFRVNYPAQPVRIVVPIRKIPETRIDDAERQRQKAVENFNKLPDKK